MTGTKGYTWSATDECVRRWKWFAAAAVIAVTAAVVIAACFPKEYSAQVKISDERKETDILLGLNNFSAWARGTINERKGYRMPEVYAQTVTTREFAEEMSKVKVEGYHTDYYHYILEHHRAPWWKRFFCSDDDADEHDRVVEIIQGNIRSEASSRYNTTLLHVTDQDPVVAAMMVDTIRVRLEQKLKNHYYVRAFRDVIQTREKMALAETRYRRAQKEYIDFTDSHQDITSPAATSQEEHLMAEYESAFDAYNKECEQFRRAQALLDKQPSTFAVLKNATVPTRPSRPATVGYVLSFLFIALTLTMWVVLGRRKYLEYKTSELPA